MLCNPCNPESPTPRAGRKSELATSPLPTRRPRRERKCYVTLAFSGIPNAKRWDITRTGYLTATFSGAHNRAEVLHNPCILGGQQRQVPGENKKRLPHPYLFGGLEEGRSAM